MQMQVLHKRKHVLVSDVALDKIVDSHIRIQ